MSDKLTPLRRKMLDWIADGRVSRGRDPFRFALGGFPHATIGAADNAASWLIHHDYVRLPVGGGYDQPFELTDKGRSALAESRGATNPSEV